MSGKVHSVYQREIQDIPMQDKQTVLLLNTRKMFCLNENCSHKTFSERFAFISSNLKVISRDGAQTYVSAVRNAHHDAVQISDRFHLIKN